MSVAMRRIALIIWTVAVWLATVALSTAASELQLTLPPQDHQQILTTLSGSTNIGRIIAIEADTIRFKTKFGTLIVPTDQIATIEDLPPEHIKNGQYWFPSPNYTRLYFSPTGRMLEKGTGYLTDSYIFFPSVAYGITNSITIGAGTSIFPGIPLNEQLYFFTPKIGFQARDHLHLAAGALLVNVPFKENSPIVGVLYGVGTYGTLNRSVTFGLGYGFADDKLADKPVVMLGLEQRLAQRISFVSENWIFPEVDQPLVSYGLRFFSKKLSFDFALLNLLGDGAIYPGIPYIDIVFNF